MSRPVLAATSLVFLLVAAGPAPAENLLTNGEFEQALSVGWNQDVGGSGYKTIDRAIDFDPDPDFEARCSLYAGAGYARLSQVVDVPGTNLELDFRGSFAIGAGSSTCWPVASVCVTYRDAGGTYLGETRIYRHNEYCDWANSPTLHLIEVVNPDWQEYSLDVNDEITTNLPGVNPADVGKVEVSLYDYTSGG